MPGAFRLHPPREQRVTRRQELEIAETDTAQACRAWLLHDEDITHASAATTLHSLFTAGTPPDPARGSPFSTRRSRFFSGSSLEIQYSPGTSSLDAQAFPLWLKRRVWRCGVRATCSVSLSINPSPGRPGSEQRQSFSDKRDGLTRMTPSRQSIPPLLPLFDSAMIEPSDPKEHIDRACVALRRKRCLGRFGDPFCKCGLILPTHDDITQVAIDG